MIEFHFDQASYPEEAAALRLLDVPASACVLGIDMSAPASGVAHLIAVKRKGLAAAVLPILPDPFESTLGVIGQSIGTTTNPDLRMEQFAALRLDQLLVNGQRPSQLIATPEAHANAAALVLRVADIILLGAPGERDRWSHLLTRTFRRFELLPVAERAAPTAFDEAGVTVYAPQTPVERIAPWIALLRSRGIEPSVVAAGSTAQPSTRVVVAPEWRPLRARSLAAAGYRVVAPNVTRVDECDARILGYQPADYRSFLGAVDAARSGDGERARIVTAAEAVSTTIAREAARVLNGPRCSIIVRTFDRPALLERAVASIAAQNYRDVEIVVVNNGGADVREVVESAAAGRPVVYERMPERRTISAASNVGARAATGTYIGYLDDDDLLYGDHCARTVEVLERTKADLVFTMCVAEYARMNGADKQIIGYQVYLDRQYHPDDIYISNISPIHSIVHPRSLFDRFGYFDEELPVTDDWELWLRVVSGGGRFVRIERVTCEYSWRYDPARGNMTVDHQWDFVHAYEKITARYAKDIVGRTSLHTQQANTLAQQRKRAEDAADPAKRSEIVVGSMNKNLVPVDPYWERGIR